MGRNNGNRGGGGNGRGSGKKKNQVYCKYHNGMGPGPIRKWNKHYVCANCYKTLTKFRHVPSSSQQRPQPQSTSEKKGFFARLFNL